MSAVLYGALALYYYFASNLSHHNFSGAKKCPKEKPLFT